MGVSYGGGDAAGLPVSRSAVLASEQQLLEQWEGTGEGESGAMHLVQEPC